MKSKKTFSSASPTTVATRLSLSQHTHRHRHRGNHDRHRHRGDLDGDAFTELRAAHRDEIEDMSYEEEDTCMSYEEEDTCLRIETRLKTLALTTAQYGTPLLITALHNRTWYVCTRARARIDLGAGRTGCEHATALLCVHARMATPYSCDRRVVHCDIV